MIQVGRFEVRAAIRAAINFVGRSHVEKVEVGDGYCAELTNHTGPCPRDGKLLIPSWPPRVFCCRGWSEVRKREPQFSGALFLMMRTRFTVHDDRT